MMRITSGLALFALLFSAADFAVHTAKADPLEGVDVVVSEKPFAPYPTSSTWNVESHYENVTSSGGGRGSRASWWQDRGDGDYWIVEIYGLLRDNYAYERYLERVYFQEEKVWARRCDMALFRAVKSTDRSTRADSPGFEMFSFWYYQSGCSGQGKYRYCTGQYGGLGPDPPEKLVKAHIEVLKNGKFNAELVAMGIDAKEFGLDCCQFDQGSGGGGPGCKSLDTKCIKHDEPDKCRDWLENECLDCNDYARTTNKGEKKYKKCLKKTGQIYTFADGYDDVCKGVDVINN